MYDYGWHQYMPDVGRWMQLDPLVEDTEDPYAYVFNNPISLTDPDGRAPEDSTEDCCSNLKGFALSMMDNVTGGNLVQKYNDGSAAYNDGVRTGNTTSFIAGGLLMYTGGTDIGAGTAGLVASGGASSTGVGTIAGVPGAVVSGGLILTGTAKVGLGGVMMYNSSKNLQNDKKFGGQNDTESKSGKAAHRQAKDQNGVPRSQQPDKQYKTPAKNTGKSLRTYEYTNSKGKKVVVRKDNPTKYKDGGSQGNHYNAGDPKQNNGKLKQHHNY